MARFGPLSRNGRYEIVETAGPTPARFLFCELEVPPALRPLETGAPPPSVAPPVVLAADDQFVLQGLMDEATVGAPQREEGTGAQAHRAWTVADRRWESRVRDSLEHVVIRPLSRLPEGERVRVAVAPLSERHLRFTPWHRGLSGLTTFDPDKFLTIVAEYARVHELEQPLEGPGGVESARAQLASMATGHHAVLAVLPDGSGKILRFRQGLDVVHIRAMPRSPTLRSLDLTLLNALVFRTVLGIQDPETLPHRRVSAVDSLEQLVQNVQRGQLQAGFALNPVPQWEVRAVMEAQQDLPSMTMQVEPAAPGAGGS